MDNIHVAKVYAKALLEISIEKKNSELIEEELIAVSESLTQDSEVWEFLLSPKISKDQKIKVVENSFKSSVSETINSLLFLLLKRSNFLY